MRQNYEEQYRNQREAYERSRNPFEYGQDVARRRYSEILAGLEAQDAKTQQSYSDMYQAARQRAVRGQAMGGPSLSGGMGQQQRDYISAMEMQELTKIGTARQQAAADLYTQRQAAFSNAQLEGQQATQMELQNRQAELGLVQQKQEILGNDKLSYDQKVEQLAAIGADPGEVRQKTGLENALNNAVSGGLLVGLGTTAILGLKALGTTFLKATAITALGAIATKALIFGGIALAVIGIGTLIVEGFN